MMHYVIGGVRYPRVTRITSLLSAPQLERWKLKKVAELAQFLAPDDAVQHLEDAARASLARGTIIHEAAVALGRGEKPAAGPQHAPYLAALRRFWEEYEVEPLAQELLVWSPQHGYAGTCDLLARTNAGTALLDLKTSKACYPPYRLQLAAYRWAEQPGFPEEPQWCGVVLLSEGEYRIERVDAEKDFQAFLALLTLYRWLDPDNEVTGGGVLGQEAEEVHSLSGQDGRPK